MFLPDYCQQIGRELTLRWNSPGHHSRAGLMGDAVDIEILTVRSTAVALDISTTERKFGYHLLTNCYLEHFDNGTTTVVAQLTGLSIEANSLATQLQ